MYSLFLRQIHLLYICRVHPLPSYLLPMAQVSIPYVFDEGLHGHSGKNLPHDRCHANSLVLPATYLSWPTRPTGFNSLPTGICTVLPVYVLSTLMYKHAFLYLSFFLMISYGLYLSSRLNTAHLNPEVTFPPVSTRHLYPVWPRNERLPHVLCMQRSYQKTIPHIYLALPSS